MATGNKKSSSRSGYVGSSTFPEQTPVCKPAAPGRHPKPLEGPVHPGFKGKPKAPKKVDYSQRPVLVRSSQNDDLYKPTKKTIYPKKKS